VAAPLESVRLAPAHESRLEMMIRAVSGSIRALTELVAALASGLDRHRLNPIRIHTSNRDETHPASAAAVVMMMMTTLGLPIALTLCFLGIPVGMAAEGTSFAAQAAAPSSIETPLHIVETAFDRMLNFPAVRTVRMEIFRNGRKVTYRAFDMVYQNDAGGGHTLLRFTGPDYLRDSAVLIVEKESGGNDAWLYQPQEGRMRRVSTHQKRDSFYGSDFTFEDFEHQRWSRYELRRLEDSSDNDRDFFVVEAIPPADSQYSKLYIWVEKERYALARMEFFHGTPARHVKTLRVDLEGLIEKDGHLDAKRLTIEQTGRDTSTELNVLRTETDFAIARRVFSTMRLEREGENLFDLVKRLQVSHPTDRNHEPERVTGD